MSRERLNMAACLRAADKAAADDYRQKNAVDRFRAAEGADLPLQPHPPAAVSPAHGIQSAASRESFQEPTRHDLRERLQVLECWKVDAGLEAPLIEDLIWHYRDALGLTEIPTNQHDPGYWEEKHQEFATPTGTLDPFDEVEGRN